ncbi:MAG: dihydropteroate synthase [Gemmatimonadota bacterium]
MRVVPLAAHSPRAVREKLIAYGWDDNRAEVASSGLGPVCLWLSGLSDEALLALVRHAGHLGIDIFTGEDWALLSSSHSRMGALARPWVVPPELSQLAHDVGVALPAPPATEWETARGIVRLDRPVVMGILNLTPDSFSDGGQFLTPDAALEQADRLLSEGADILDLGGESTRPGRPEPVPIEEEIARVIPVVEALVRRHPGILISVDTVKSAVATRALGSGAAIINDVSAFRIDPEMAHVSAAAGAGVVLMHSRGDVSSMATLDHADYEDDLLQVVRSELAASLRTASDAGIVPGRIAIDPGIGFAKTAEQNMLLCDRLAELLPLGCPLLVGPSRKRFLGVITGREVSQRDVATAAVCVLAYERGARLFRVHNVAATRDALLVAHAITAA